MGRELVTLQRSTFKLLMITLKYKLFNTYLPAILALISLVLTALALAGQSNEKRTSAEFYIFKLDFTNIRYDQVLHPYNETLFSGRRLLRKYFTVGFWGYCQTDYQDYDYFYYYCDIHKEGAFQYDLYDIVEDDGLSYVTRQYVDYILLPEGIEVSKGHVSVMYVANWIGLLLIAFTMVMYLWVMLFTSSDSPKWFVPFFNACAALALSLCAGLAKAVFSKIIRGYQKQYDVFGITASFGNRKFHVVLWVSVALQILIFLMVVISKYLLSISKSSEQDIESLTTPPPANHIPLSPIRPRLPRTRTPAPNSSTRPDNEDLPPRYEDINKHRPPKAPSFFSRGIDGSLVRYSSR